MENIMLHDPLSKSTRDAIMRERYKLARVERSRQITIRQGCDAEKAIK